MNEPTAEDCSTRKSWTDSDGFHHLAFWWPQMGGYVGKAVARIESLTEPDRGDCVMVWVWHDGEFPFSEEEGTPAVLHICDFGDWLSTFELLFEFQSGKPIKQIPRPQTATIPELTFSKTPANPGVTEEDYNPDTPCVCPDCGLVLDEEGD